MAPCPGRGKSWVLAMLAPKRGLRVAPVPPKTADLTRPAHGGRDNGRSGRRNRRFDRTKEQSRTSWPCRYDLSSLTVRHPMVGETEHASHTEIRTLPCAGVFLQPAASRQRGPGVAATPRHNRAGDRQRPVCLPTACDIGLAPAQDETRPGSVAARPPRNAFAPPSRHHSQARSVQPGFR